VSPTKLPAPPLLNGACVVVMSAKWRLLCPRLAERSPKSRRREASPAADPGTVAKPVRVLSFACASGTPRAIRLPRQVSRYRIPSTAAIHDSGRIRCGPDGMLYVANGDAGDDEAAQKMDSRIGKLSGCAERFRSARLCTSNRERIRADLARMMIRL
jgi:glucose/arabinose dehydrogenase